jgi:hypothetical protein
LALGNGILSAGELASIEKGGFSNRHMGAAERESTFENQVAPAPTDEASGCLRQ